MKKDPNKISNARKAGAVIVVVLVIFVAWVCWNQFSKVPTSQKPVIFEKGLGEGRPGF